MQNHQRREKNKGIFRKKYSSPATDQELVLAQNYFINQININGAKKQSAQDNYGTKQSPDTQINTLKKKSAKDSNIYTTGSNLEKDKLKSSKIDLVRQLSPNHLVSHRKQSPSYKCDKLNDLFVKLVCNYFTY